MVRKHLGHRHWSTVQIRGYPRRAGSAAYGRAYLPSPYKDFRVIIFFTEVFFWGGGLTIYTDENYQLINFTFRLLHPHFKAWIIHKISDTQVRIEMELFTTRQIYGVCKSTGNYKYSHQWNSFMENSYWNDLCNPMSVLISIILVFSRNASHLRSGNRIYTRPSILSILVQPSDGEVGIDLPVQPQLVFLDEKVASQIWPPFHSMYFTSKHPSSSFSEWLPWEINNT